MQTARLRTIASKQEHDGPQLSEFDRKRFKGKDSGLFPKKPAYPEGKIEPDSSKENRYGLQTFLWTPWNNTRGNEEDSAPSLGTTIIALLLLFVSCLTYGWAYGSVLAYGYASTASVFEQGFIYGIVSGLLYVVTKHWTFEPTLPTYLYISVAFASVFSFDLGLLPFVMVFVVMGGGYASAGGILNLFVTNGAISTPPPHSTSFYPVLIDIGPRWMYWFFGSMIAFNYLLLKKFYPKHEKEERHSHRMSRVILYTGLLIAALVVAFSPYHLTIFDSGMWITIWVATGISEIMATNMHDWAFFFFVPAAMGVTAALLYTVIYWIKVWSDSRDERLPAEEVDNRLRFGFNAPMYAVPRKNKQKIDVYNA